MTDAALDALPLRFADLSTDEARAVTVAARPCVALVPTGSVEPHGPHLPLGTDTVISEEAARRAALVLRSRGVAAFVAPPIPYGVTEFAEGFAGALSVPAAALTAFAAAVVDALLRGGLRHVCLVNNHLEPAHDDAVRRAIAHVAPGRASVACPLTRHWARTLSDEFKRGNCHAGRYETSLVLAAGGAPRCDLGTLPALEASLSEGIRRGATSFREMGMDRAYTGAPAEATPEEGDELFLRLAAMIVEEVTAGLSLRPSSP